MLSGSSPNIDARFAGALYLIVIVGGAFAQAFVRQRLVVGGDADATAANLLANEQLYRLGFVADLVPLLCNVILTVILFDLFRVVDGRLAAIAALFAFVGTGIQAAALLFHIGPLVILSGGPALSGLSEPQVRAIAYAMIRLQTAGYTIALVFFGCFGLCLGFLIVRSTFLPRFLGVLMALAGLSYVGNSLLSFVVPTLASGAFLLPALVGEATLTLWLLTRGVDSVAWRSQEAKTRAAPGLSAPAVDS